MKMVFFEGSEVVLTSVNASKDFTHPFKVDGLASNAQYSYQVQCVQSGGMTFKAFVASSKLSPLLVKMQQLTLFWVSCLSGQGYGHNP